MLKQKPKGNSPLLDNGKPKLEEVKVTPVDDLVAQMAEASAQAVRELNEGKREERPDRCRIGCSCGPCRDGFCGNCMVERARSPEEADYLYQRYRNHRVPMDVDASFGERWGERGGGIGYSLPTWAVEEWERHGTGWDSRGNPVIRRREDDDHFRAFMRYVLDRTPRRSARFDPYASPGMEPLYRRANPRRFSLADDDEIMDKIMQRPPDFKL